MLSLDKLLATVLAHAIVAARHYESVLRVAQADEALGLRVVIDYLLALLSTILIRHAVDRLEFER